MVPPLREVHVISVFPSGWVNLDCGLDPRIFVTSSSDIPGFSRVTSLSRMEGSVVPQEIDNARTNEVTTKPRKNLFPFHLARTPFLNLWGYAPSNKDFALFLLECQCLALVFDPG